MYSAQLISLFWLENCIERMVRISSTGNFTPSQVGKIVHIEWASVGTVSKFLKVVKHHLHVWSADVLVHEW